jgi:hypothetical protein
MGDPSTRLLPRRTGRGASAISAKALSDRLVSASPAKAGRRHVVRPSHNVAPFGIKQAIEVAAPGLSELGHLVLCERLGLHRLFDLQGDDFLARSGAEFFQNGPRFESPRRIGIAVTCARAAYSTDAPG